MAFLLRVALPDVPGSLGRLASALGAVGADIGALEIVDQPDDGTVVDDILLELPAGGLPENVVSACQALDGVEVLWISRYHAGGNLFLDLEVVEELTTDRDRAVDRLVGLLPVTFRVDWAAKLQRVNGIGHVVLATETTPQVVEWVDLAAPTRLPDDGETLRVGVPVGTEQLIVMGRDGGPPFLDSELARAGHLVALAVSIAGGAQ